MFICLYLGALPAAAEGPRPVLPRATYAEPGGARGFRPPWHATPALAPGRSCLARISKLGTSAPDTCVCAASLRHSLGKTCAPDTAKRVSQETAPGTSRDGCPHRRGGGPRDNGGREGSHASTSQGTPPEAGRGWDPAAERHQPCPDLDFGPAASSTASMQVVSPGLTVIWPRDLPTGTHRLPPS